MTTWVLVLVISMNAGGAAEVRIPGFPDLAACTKAEHDYIAKGEWFSVEHKCIPAGRGG